MYRDPLISDCDKHEGCYIIQYKILKLMNAGEETLVIIAIPPRANVKKESLCKMKVELKVISWTANKELMERIFSVVV